jgi:tetratricopeptide (TPR) repeat protein
MGKTASNISGKGRLLPSLLSPWFIFLLAFLIYLPTVNHQFALDDYSVIHENRHVQAGFEGMDEILTTNYRHGQQNFNDGLYRPLSLITFALEKEWFDSNPFFGHFFNILLYAVACLLLYLALLRIMPLPQSWVWLAVVIFILHPLHTEVVANIKSRDELLAFLGFSAALLGFANYIRNKQPAFLALAALAALIAYFSKESAIVMVLLVPLFLYADPAFKKKQLLVPVVLLGGLAAFYLFCRWQVLSAMENPVDAGNFNLLNNPIAATENTNLKWGGILSLQTLFLQKLLFPFPLLHDYSYISLPLQRIVSIPAIWGLFILLVGGWFSVKGLLKREAGGVMIAAYFTSIAIASQFFVPIGVQFAERLLFMAVLPFTLAILFYLNRLAATHFKFRKKLHSTPAKITMGAVLIGMGFATVSRSLVWENNFTLYRADIEKNPASARVNYNYGTELSNQAGQAVGAQRSQLLTQSIHYLEQAIAIYPDYLDAYNNLGIAYKMKGEQQKAIAVFQRNIKKDPAYAKNYYNLATAYLELKQYEQAIRYLEAYVSQVPGSASAYYLLGKAAGHLNRFDQAVSYLNQGLRLDPNHPDILYFLGMAYGFSKEYEKADQAFKRLLQIQPGNTEVLLNLAINEHQLGNYEAEKNYLQRILQINPNHPAAKQQLRLLNTPAN